MSDDKKMLLTWGLVENLTLVDCHHAVLLPGMDQFVAEMGLKERSADYGSTSRTEAE